MNAKEIMQIFQDTAYVRTGGSPEELKCAEYLIGKCKELGLEAKLEPFPVQMAEIVGGRTPVASASSFCVMPLSASITFVRNLIMSSRSL